MTELNKETEAKLWDSFREGESRERALKKQLARLQKSKSLVDIQNEVLQIQVREEQEKPAMHEQNQSKTRKNTADGSKNKKLSELESRLKRFEGINVENLVHELTNKTALIEDLLKEKKER